MFGSTARYSAASGQWGGGIVSRVAAALAVFALVGVGCSSASATAAPTAAPTTAPTQAPTTVQSSPTALPSPSLAPINVTFITGVTGDAFFVTQTCGADKAAAEFNVNFSYQGTTTADYAQEITAFNAAVVSKPDAIIVVPFSDTAFVQPVQDAINQGIVVVLNNAGLSVPNLGAREYQTDNQALGKLAAEGLAKAMGEKGKVAIQGGVAALVPTQDRIAGFKAGIAEYPGMQVVSTQFSNGDTNKAASEVTSVLTANPDLGGIFGVDQGNAEGAAAAVKAAGLAGKVKLVAYDTSPQEVSDLRAGVFLGLVGQDPYDYGYQTVKFAAQVVRKEVDPKSLPFMVLMPGKWIDMTNVDSPDSKPFLYATTC